MYGHMASGKALLRAGADMGLRNTHGQTALDRALHGNKNDFVTLLKSHEGHGDEL